MPVLVCHRAHARRFHDHVIDDSCGEQSKHRVAARTALTPRARSGTPEARVLRAVRTRTRGQHRLCHPGQGPRESCSVSGASPSSRPPRPHLRWWGSRTRPPARTRSWPRACAPSSAASAWCWGTRARRRGGGTASPWPRCGPGAAAAPLLPPGAVRSLPPRLRSATDTKAETEMSGRVLTGGSKNLLENKINKALEIWDQT